MKHTVEDKVEQLQETLLHLAEEHSLIFKQNKSIDADYALSYFKNIKELLSMTILSIESLEDEADMLDYTKLMLASKMLMSSLNEKIDAIQKMIDDDDDDDYYDHY